MDKQYFVYIMSNNSNTVTYTGFTNNLVRRVYEHKNELIKGFTTRYKIHKLVYHEFSEDAESAILREKQIKAGSRKKKAALIENMNKEWIDLYENL